MPLVRKSSEMIDSKDENTPPPEMIDIQSFI
jgi:hypothetical protein